MWTLNKRILKNGWVNFTRGGIVSMASILIMTITLFVIISLIFIQAILFSSLEQIKNKIDITIYFNLKTPENKIFSLKENLEKIPEVSSISYVSAEESLKLFKETHAEDFIILEALEELEENPLSAYLNIKAKEANQYESIVNFLQSDSTLASDGVSIIEKINYHQNKVIIDRLILIINWAKKFGLGLTILLILISMIITFNTIRLTIFISRQEIGVMKLVGAPSKYVRGPFMVEGALYGVFATLITIVIFFPITLWFGNNLTNFFGLNLYHYYLANFLSILGIVFISSLALGIISSFLAVNKYLKK